MELKTANWILTVTMGIGGLWRRDIDLASLMGWLKKQRGVKNYLIYQAVLKEDTTEDERCRFLTFFNVTDMGGLSKATDLTDDDEKLIKNKFLGWIQTPYIDKEVKEKLKSKKK